MVLFDLPVGTKRERKAATKFREFLLDEGFGMCQYSVYMRFCAGKEQTEAYIRRISASLPESGAVQVLCFTDKQYEKIISFRGRRREPNRKNSEQFVLF